MFLVCGLSFPQRHLFSRLSKWRSREFLPIASLCCFSSPHFQKPIWKKASLNPIPGDKEMLHFTLWSLHSSCVTQCGIVLKDSGPCYNYLHKNSLGSPCLWSFFNCVSLLSHHIVARLREFGVQGVGAKGGWRSQFWEGRMGGEKTKPSFTSNFWPLFPLSLTSRGLKGKWNWEPHPEGDVVLLSLLFSFPSSLLHVSSSPFCLHLMSIFFTPFRFPFFPFNLQSFMEVFITPATQVSGSQTAF